MNDRDALERKLRYCLDRQEIVGCIIRNSRGNDRFDAELVTRSYHPDGWLELGRHPIAGPAYGRHANDAHGAVSELSLHNVTMQSEIDAMSLTRRAM